MFLHAFWADHLKLEYVQLLDLGYRGRYIMLQDHFFMERGQPDAQPSPGLNSSSFYFCAERASIPFKEWVTQLQIEMWHRTSFGGPKLPGTSSIHVHNRARDLVRWFLRYASTTQSEVKVVSLWRLQKRLLNGIDTISLPKD